MVNDAGRKVIHILFGVFLVIGILLNLIDAKLLFYLLIFSCVLSLLSFKFNLPIISWLLKNFGKKEEKIPGRGFLFFLAGVILVLRLFPVDIALASITILTFSDSINCIIGKYYGRTKCSPISMKNLEGLLAGVIIGTLTSMIFVSFVEAFAASFFATLVELVEVKVGEENLDDNLLLPLVAGTIIYLLRIWII